MDTVALFDLADCPRKRLNAIKGSVYSMVFEADGGTYVLLLMPKVSFDEQVEMIESLELKHIELERDWHEAGENPSVASEAIRKYKEGM